MTRPVFVFGSNLLGVHGAGAAKFAVERRGAAMGAGSGPQGDAYAIPTKRTPRDPLPLGEIRRFVAEFLAHAARSPDRDFQVTRIGCGLAGYADGQIAPMFEGAPENCRFDPAWAKFGYRPWPEEWEPTRGRRPGGKST